VYGSFRVVRTVAKLRPIRPAFFVEHLFRPTIALSPAFESRHPIWLTMATNLADANAGQMGIGLGSLDIVAANAGLHIDHRRRAIPPPCKMPSSLFWC
jgi:hypothetical protein